MENDDHIAIAALFECARRAAKLEPALQSHLDHCDFCGQRLSWMGTVTALGARESAYEPPQSVMDGVLRLGRSASRLKQLREALVACLTFDSFSDPVPSGVRRNDAASRQMTYEADDLEIALWLRRSEGQTATLTGQVLSKSGGPVQDESAFVDLVAEGDHVSTSPLSPWGEFVFPDLPRTQCGLQLSVAGRVLRIPLLPMIDAGQSQ